MNESTEEAWTDDRIREAFIYDGGESEYHDPINGAREQRRIAGAIFDAWLDRRVRASNREALIRELIERAGSFGDRHWDQESVTAWLRACIVAGEDAADRSEQ
jgi:hypothetical protein